MRAHSVKNRQTASLDSRRKFLKQTALTLSAAIAAPLASRAGTSAATGGVRELREDSPQLKIGVFDTAFPDLSLDQLLEVVKQFKIEAVEIGSGNDPGHAHCDLDGLLTDDSKRRAFMAQFEKNGTM